MQNNSLPGPLEDAPVRAVIERLIETRRRPFGGSPINNLEMSRDPYDYAEYGFSIYPEQGDLIYLLCRGMRVTRVVDFATSIGMSAIGFTLSDTAATPGFTPGFCTDRRYKSDYSPKKANLLDIECRSLLSESYTLVGACPGSRGWRRV